MFHLGLGLMLEKTPRVGKRKREMVREKRGERRKLKDTYSRTKNKNLNHTLKVCTFNLYINSGTLTFLLDVI